MERGIPISIRAEVQVGRDGIGRRPLVERLPLDQWKTFDRSDTKNAIRLASWATAPVHAAAMSDEAIKPVNSSLF